MLNRMISTFQDLLFIPLEEQDYSGFEPVVLYMSSLFLLFLCFLYL